MKEPLRVPFHVLLEGLRASTGRAVHAAGGYQIEEALEEQLRAQEGGQLVAHAQQHARAADWLDGPPAGCLTAVPTSLEMEGFSGSRRSLINPKTTVSKSPPLDMSHSNLSLLSFVRSTKSVLPASHRFIAR